MSGDYHSLLTKIKNRLDNGYGTIEGDTDNKIPDDDSRWTLLSTKPDGGSKGSWTSMHGGRGATGVAGKDGTPGVDGADGRDGDPGEKGEKGDQGDVYYIRGLQGDQGIQGERGERGLPGKDGHNPYRGDWDRNSDYIIGDIVLVNTRLYTRRNSNIAGGATNFPPSSDGNWLSMCGTDGNNGLPEIEGYV